MKLGPCAFGEPDHVDVKITHHFEIGLLKADVVVVDMGDTHAQIPFF